MFSFRMRRIFKYQKRNGTDVLKRLIENTGGENIIYSGKKLFFKGLFVSDNCHSHVARALNYMKFKKKKNYTMVSIWLILAIKSKYINFGGVI